MTAMATAVTTTEPARTTGAMSVYQKMNDPLAAATQLGEFFHKSQMMGISTAGDGVVLALTCMAEGITPLDFVRKYHLIQGKPSMRADAMLAEFRRAGGKCQWVNTGDDGNEARAKFSYDGQELEVAYTIGDGKRAAGEKFGKKDSNWQKDPGAMLRARLITKSVRMLAPELVAGVYSPEEIEVVTPQPSGRDESELAARRAELAAMDSASGDASDAVDVPFEPTTTVEVADTSEPIDPTAKCTNEQLMQLATLGDQAGLSLEEVQKGIQDAANVEDPSDMTHGQAVKLIAQFQAAIDEAKK